MKKTHCFCRQIPLLCYSYSTSRSSHAYKSKSVFKEVVHVKLAISFLPFLIPLLQTSVNFEVLSAGVEFPETDVLFVFNVSSTLLDASQVKNS